jgi:iron complex outermembrane receptor protein
MHRSRCPSLIVYIASAAALCAATALHAQGAPASVQPGTGSDGGAGLAEVVVTAQRRSENIQNVPIAINAFSGQALQDAGVQTSVQIQQLTPDLTFVGTAGEGQKVNVVLRGVGLNTSSENVEGNVGVYIDDAYIANTSALSFGLFDMDRVEVLKGPQGTLFGEAETGGLIHYITRKPEQPFSTDAYLQYGSYNSRQFQGEIGGGIAPGLAVRASVLYDRDDGYVTNSLGPNKNRTDAYGVRLQALWKPTDRFSALLQFRDTANRPDLQYTFKPQVVYLNPADGLVEALPANVNFFHTCAGCDAAGNPPSIQNGSIWSVTQNTPGYLNVRDQAVDLTLKYDLGFGTLTYITDVSNTNKTYGEDSDGGPGTSVTQQTYLRASQVQQEARLNGGQGPLTWTAGIFYLHRKSDSTFNVNFLGATYHIFPPWISSAIDNYSSDYISGYGQLEYSVTHTVKLITGADYFSNRPTDDVVNQRIFATGSVATTLKTTGPADSSDAGGKIGATWSPRAHTMLYATISRGNRPASYQNPGTIAAGVSPVVAKESLTAYEVGFKQEFEAIPARLNGSAYYYDYRDMQTRAFLGFTSYELNKNARVYGVDLTADLLPIQHLDISANLGLLHGTVYDVALPVTLGPIPVIDTSIPNAPQVSGSVQARYTQPLSHDSDVFVAVTESYRGGTYSEINNNPAQRVGAYGLLSLRVGYHFPGRHIEAGIFGDNLLNRQYYDFIGAVTSIGDAQRFPGRPRWLGGYIRYTY